MKTLNPNRAPIPLLILCTLLFLFSASSLKAQRIENTDMFGVSIGGGYTFSHTDFEWTKTIPSPVVGFGIHYFSLDYLAVNFDFQKGRLKGGSSLSDADNTKTGFENSYYAFCLSFRFFPISLAGADIENDRVLKALSTFYGGTGVGLTGNNVKANNIPNAVYGVQTRYRGSNFFIPLELGVNIPVARINSGQLLVNINLRTSLCFSDKIDGYEPNLEANRHNDAYSTLTGGVVYKFGL